MAVTGEIRFFAFSFTPLNWLSCNGQSVLTSQHPELFAAIGTSYGGNANSFNVPDLRGRALMGVDPAVTSPGTNGGEESVLLEMRHLPIHSHSVNISKEGNTGAVNGAFLAENVSESVLSFAPGEVGELYGLNDQTLHTSGGNKVHENRMPSLALNACIATGKVPGGALLGEIQMNAGSYCPEGWELCQGQSLSVQQNRALFSLLGFTYGGDGVDTFALPNLAGRIPITAGQGSGLSDYQLGQYVGAESVTLSVEEIPEHNHWFGVSGNMGVTNNASGNYLAGRETVQYCHINYFMNVDKEGPFAILGNETIGNTPATTQPHENRQPFLTVNYMIAVNGDYPQQSS